MGFEAPGRQLRILGGHCFLRNSTMSISRLVCSRLHVIRMAATASYATAPWVLRLALELVTPWSCWSEDAFQQ